MKIKAIVTDIEGTTTRISFVHEVLFPYAAAHMAQFVKTNAQSPDVSKIVEAVKSVAMKQGYELISIDQVIQQLLTWIDQDKKITPLKTLQGMIWKEGYQNGDFTGHLYRDVPEMLKLWSEKGISLYVYSSGSIEAQQLLFKFSDYGDLTGLFTDYFDTNIGAKRDIQSYRNISDSIKLPSEQILFLSDVEEELDAAGQTGIKTCCLMRETHKGASRHPKAVSFLEVNI